TPVRPSAASALPGPAPIVRLDVVPVLSWSWPVALTVDGVDVPVMLSIAVRTDWMVSWLPAPVPIVTLPLASVVVVVCDVLKVMVLLLIFSTDPLVGGVARSLEAAPATPTNLV